MSDVPTEPLPFEPRHLGDGRYELHHRLGAGGMGLVCQATDTRLGRQVAVKLLADNLAADHTARERFLREARAAARLSDPHVVQVHDVDEENGRPYLVMELVEGPSLAEVLAVEGPMDPQAVTEVAADALAGIARAHERGLLHRDIKPGNLLRTPSGAIKVTDFGVAQAADDSQLTRTGMVIGSGPYLAPERRTGQPATVRTDLYALGATLHELLTARTPEDDRELGEPGDLSVELPGPLHRLLERLLAHDPQQRPASAEAALALLTGEVAPSGGATTPSPEGDEDATTRVRPATPPEPAATTARELVGTASPAPAGGDAGDTAVLEAEPDDVPAGDRSPQIPWGVVVGVAVVLLLVAVVFQGLRSGDGAVDEPTGVERTDDPAETARNLAEWLQERAGE